MVLKGSSKTTQICITCSDYICKHAEQDEDFFILLFHTCTLILHFYEEKGKAIYS